MIAATVVALDVITKAIAVQELSGRGLVSVFGGALHLELYRNFAGPGNILQGHSVLVSLLSLGAVLLLVVVGWSIRGAGFATGIGLLLGGGVGNLLDRIFAPPGPLRGGVIDWLKPTLSSGSMNLADLAINAGVLALLVALTLDWWGTRGRSRGAIGHRQPLPPEG